METYLAQIAGESDAQHPGNEPGFKRARANESVAPMLARKLRALPLTDGSRGGGICESNASVRTQALESNTLVEQRLYRLLQREEELATQLAEEARVSAAVRALVSEIDAYSVRMEEEDLG